MNTVNKRTPLHRLLFAAAGLCPLLLPTAAAQSAAESSSTPDDEVVVLSPFEVVSDQQGYYSANTMSGTRFNTRIEDLASAVTIVTKEQMNDFAMLDINDVFLYTAGAEGTGTYTDIVVDRNGSVSDNVQLNPTQANRVRGLSSANIAFNNIEMQNRMPIDPLIIDGLEVSRGPNASVFGLGNPSGTVNQIAATANLQRDRYSVQLRADNWDGYRESIDVNKVLIQDKLALRVSQLFNHEEWVRKPSGVDTERYNIMLKYRPFKNTTITAGHYYYHMYGNRPNAIPPRDAISYWRDSGAPTWDPVARTVTVNGQTTGPWGATNGNYNGPTDALSSGWLGGTHSQVFINENGQITHWGGPTGVTGIGTQPVAGPNPSGPGVQPNRYLQPTPMAGLGNSSTGKGAQALFLTVPSITDRSIFDWKNVNISAPNYVWDKASVSTLQLDHVFLNTPRQTLAAQFTFLRENSERYQRNFIGIANDLGLSGLLTVDVNERLLDGTPNPYFLRPYISTSKPRTVFSPWKWDTYRGQAAYKFDFTQEDGALRFLGTHQLTGYYEYKYRVNRNYSYRDVITNDLPWIPEGVYRGNQSQVDGTPALVATTQSNFRFYVGDNQGFNADYAPRDFQYGTFNYVWGSVNPPANAPIQGMRTEQATMGLGASTDSTSGVNNLKRVLKTAGGVIQSRFWHDAIITTFGVREDEVYDIFGRRNSNGFIRADGINFNYDLVDSWDSNTWSRNSGRTTTMQFVVRPFKNFSAFQNMRGFVGDLLTDMSIGYNKSDSFLPEEPAQDLFLNKLPNSTGEDKSVTVRFNLMDNKLVISATRYKNTVYNTRNGDANVINQRVLRHDLPIVGATPARFLLWDVAGAYTAEDSRYNRQGWIAWQNPTWSREQVQAELYRVLQIDEPLATELINPALPLRATNDIEGRGTEIEVNYNPNNYWTVAASFTESEATNRNISSAVQEWIDQRMPLWTTIKDPSITDEEAAAQNNPNKLWWVHQYPGATGTGRTAEVNFESFVRQPYAVIKALEGQANPQYSKYHARISTNYRLEGMTDHSFWRKFNVGGAVRWQSKQAIGYYGVQDFPEIVTDVDVSRPIWAKDQYYFDAFVGYKTKLFDDRVAMTLQLNVRNIQEDGSLRKVYAYPNGVAHSFRIVDPRQFILTASFDL